jgi:flagellar basal body-associated protein FliL
MAESQVNTSEGVKKPSSNTILYVIIGVLVVCIIAMGVSSGMFSTKESSDLEDEEEQRADEYIEVDATTLGYEFSQNYDTAVRKYLNKNVKIMMDIFMN